MCIVSSGFETPQDGKQRVCDIIDKYITCSIPNEEEDLKLHNAVLQVQQHTKSHFKSCRKGGKECRFNFPRTPSRKIYISSPTEETSKAKVEVAYDEIKLQRSEASNVLQNFWKQIQANDFDVDKTTTDIFKDLKITQELYEEAFQLMTAKQTIVLKRNPKEQWINQYNP